MGEEENEEYLDLLCSISRQSVADRHLHLFFSDDMVCQIWLRDKSGFRPTEGGPLLGREDMLISNVLAARPRQVTIHGAAFVPPAVLAVFQSLFAADLHLEGQAPMLDKAKSACYDEKK